MFLSILISVPSLGKVIEAAIKKENRHQFKMNAATKLTS